MATSYENNGGHKVIEVNKSIVQIEKKLAILKQTKEFRVFSLRTK